VVICTAKFETAKCTVRQVHYSTQNANSIDLVFFVNGIPVATAELKTDLSVQNVTDAVLQYKHDRLPKGEPLLQFGSRALDPQPHRLVPLLRRLVQRGVGPELAHLELRVEVLEPPPQHGKSAAIGLRIGPQLLHQRRQHPGLRLVETITR
jgi:Type I restriction enzyme R protein N terminus (HSDR_N)